MWFRSRLAPVTARLSPLRRTIRLRLTLIYGGLFLVCGAGLLAVTYLLVRFTFPAASTRTYLHGTASAGHGPPPSPASPTTRQRAADLHQLLVVSGFALAAMVLVALGLGWVMAGRVLRPLRIMTTTARQLSSATLDRRLALDGPRDELKELSDTFDELLGRLERSFSSQRQFVANASHELRTPLTLERALLDAVLRDPDATPAELRRTCERLLAANGEQERLLEALLTLAISERGLDQREPLDLAELAAQVLSSRHGDSEHRGLQVQSALRPAPATGDPDLVARLIANLIDNAVRYNISGGRIEVVTETGAGQAVLSVSNTGPGIPADQVQDLFQPFLRIGASRTRTATGGGGHGLGLSIVAAIAAAHGADIETGPGLAGGLTVTVRWPGIPGTSR